MVAILFLVLTPQSVVEVALQVVVELTLVVAVALVVEEIKLAVMVVLELQDKEITEAQAEPTAAFLSVVEVEVLVVLVAMFQVLHLVLVVLEKIHTHLGFLQLALV